MPSIHAVLPAMCVVRISKTSVLAFPTKEADGVAHWAPPSRPPCALHPLATLSVSLARLAKLARRDSRQLSWTQKASDMSVVDASMTAMIATGSSPSISRASSVGDR